MDLPVEERQRIKDRAKAYKKAHPSKPPTPEQSKKWREVYLSKHPDAQSKSAKKYREANKEKVAAYYKSYVETPHGKQVKALNESKRRARSRSAPGECSVAQWEARRAMWGGGCWLKLPGCAGEGTTIDHVIPLSRGGTNWPSNLRPACKHCNCVKHSRRIL